MSKKARSKKKAAHTSADEKRQSAQWESRKKNNFYEAEAKPISPDRAVRSRESASSKIDELANLSFEQKKAAIRQLLIDVGTDVVRNDNDPTGDGDQRMIVTFEKRDIARHLFSCGGDIHDYLSNVSDLMARACAAGLLAPARSEIQRVKKDLQQPYCRSKELLNLLETRETSIRLSPLLFIVSAGKNIIGTGPQQFQDVAKLLLRNGASPVAKDVLGKTVVHYGAGNMATKMTLDVVDMCIRAAKSHHLFGKDVKLYGLKTEEMNGKSGIAGGFDPDNNRRLVYLPDERREIWVKVENMSLLKEDSDLKIHDRLTEVQDRMGTISLHELCMPTALTGLPENYEAGVLLLKKHRTSIYIKEPDGVTPFQMSSGIGQMIGARSIAKLVMEAATENGRDARKARQKANLTCAKCMVSLDKSAPICSRCRMVSYCGRDCQLSHWPEHKAECANLSMLSLEVKLDTPSNMKKFGHSFSQIFQQGRLFSQNYQQGRVFSDGGYVNPKGVKCNEKFVVKTQSNDDQCPIAVYDQTRVCQFFIYPGQRGFKEILAEIRNEPAWQGRKTFMKASFDESGTCAMYPETAGVKAHYNW
jgi:hypothetical protein